MDNMSPSDIAAVVGNDGMNGTNGLFWIFALLVLAGGGFGGFNNGYHPQYATQDFVQNGFNFNDLQAQNRDILGAISQAKYDNIANAQNIQSELLREFGDIKAYEQASMGNQNQCCSNINSNLANMRYERAQDTAAINANVTAQTQKILDTLQGNRIDALQAQINSLQMQNAMAGVVRYPMATTYGAGPMPYAPNPNPVM